MDSLKKLFECNICSGDILDPHQLNCYHVFCGCCIKTWQEKKDAGCPLCSTKILRRKCKVRDDIKRLSELFTILKETYEREFEKGSNNEDENFEEETTLKQTADEPPTEGFVNGSSDSKSKGEKPSSRASKSIKSQQGQLSDELFRTSTPLPLSAEIHSNVKKIETPKREARLADTPLEENEEEEEEGMDKDPLADEEEDGMDKDPLADEDEIVITQSDLFEDSFKEPEIMTKMVNEVEKRNWYESEDMFGKSLQSGVVPPLPSPPEAADKIKSDEEEEWHECMSPENPKENQVALLTGPEDKKKGEVKKDDENGELGLDLSLKYKPQRKYAQKKHALVFVKPLDLSTPKHSDPSTALVLRTPKQDQPSQESQLFSPRFLGLGMGEMASPSLSKLRNTSLFRSANKLTPSPKVSQDLFQQEDSIDLSFPNQIKMNESFDYSQKKRNRTHLKVVNSELQEESLTPKKRNKIDEDFNQNEEEEELKENESATPKNVDQEHILMTDDEEEMMFVDSELPDLPPPKVSQKISQKSSRVSQKSNGESLPANNSDNNSQFSSSFFPIMAPDKKYVFCTTRLSGHQVEQLKELCALCNGKIVNDFSEDVTHLIVNLNNEIGIPQTIKYFYAIAGRKWIVVFDWVVDCLQSGCLIKEDEYETSKKCESQGPINARMSTKNLFEGVHFFFGNVNTQGAPLKDCKSLLERLGGTIVEDLKNTDENVLLIGDSEDRTINYHKLFLSRKFVSVYWEWILDCVLNYKIIPLSEGYVVNNLGKNGLLHAALPSPLQYLKEYANSLSSP